MLPHRVSKAPGAGVVSSPSAGVQSAPAPTASNQLLQQLTAFAAKEGDFTADKAMFWGTPNMHNAQALAAVTGYKTLEQTEGGHELDEAKLFAPGSGIAPSEAALLWDIASARFASASHGDVAVVPGPDISGPFGMRTWARSERPILTGSVPGALLPKSDKAYGQTQTMLGHVPNLDRRNLNVNRIIEHNPVENKSGGIDYEKRLDWESPFNAEDRGVAMVAEALDMDQSEVRKAAGERPHVAKIFGDGKLQRDDRSGPRRARAYSDPARLERPKLSAAAARYVIESKLPFMDS